VSSVASGHQYRTKSGRMRTASEVDKPENYRTRSNAQMKRTMSVTSE